MMEKLIKEREKKRTSGKKKGETRFLSSKLPVEKKEKCVCGGGC